MTIHSIAQPPFRSLRYRPCATTSPRSIICLQFSIGYGRNMIERFSSVRIMADTSIPIPAAVHTDCRLQTTSKSFIVDHDCRPLPNRYQDETERGQNLLQRSAKLI